MSRSMACGAATLALAVLQPALAFDTKVSGRVTFGSSYRLEAQDPNFLGTLNAAAAGLTGLSGSGANADDANTNFRRHDATSTALKGFLDLSLQQGDFGALVRVKALARFRLARPAARVGATSPTTTRPASPSAMPARRCCRAFPGSRCRTTGSSRRPMSAGCA